MSVSLAYPARLARTRETANNNASPHTAAENAASATATRRCAGCGWNWGGVVRGIALRCPGCGWNWSGRITG